VPKLAEEDREGSPGVRFDWAHRRPGEGVRGEMLPPPAFFRAAGRGVAEECPTMSEKARDSRAVIFLPSLGLISWVRSRVNMDRR
jgi:hypothetical protein